MDQPPSRSFVEPDSSDVTWTHLIYALHGVGVALGVATSASIVGAMKRAVHGSA